MSSPSARWNAEGYRVGTTYLLHFSRRYVRAQHYLGFTTRLDERIKQHLRGRGSPLVRAVRRAGIQVSLARTWEQVTSKFERRGHQRNHASEWCPICAGPAALLRHRPYLDEVRPGSYEARNAIVRVRFPRKRP